MITAEQRAARKMFVGSSDAPAICGVDPWKSAYAVWLEKVYEVEDLPNEGPIARGNRYEAGLLDFAEERLGPLERNVSVQHADGICAANLDARLVLPAGFVGRGQGVEAKTSSLGQEFGEEGTDEVPERVIVQAHHQMRADDLGLVWVPVLLSKHGRLHEAMYRVDRDEALIEIIAAKCHAFWVNHVLTRIPPEKTGPPALDVLKRIRRQPQTTVTIDPWLIANWEVAKAQKKEAEKAEEAAKEAALAALGDAEAGDYGDPAKLLTYYEQTRKGYYVEPATYRVARIQKR